MKQHPTPPEVTAPIVVMLVMLLSGCTESSGGGAHGASAPSSSDVSDAGPVTQHLAGSSSRLTPGTYQFSVERAPGTQTPDALVAVPRGFEDGADWYVVSPDGDTFLGLWTVGTVQRDACLRPMHDYATPGPAVDDLAEALASQQSTRATVPEPVIVGGHHGLYVELAGPPDLSRCDRNPTLWGPGERGIYGNAQVDRLWILDVDGQRLVVDASHGPRSTTLERHKLTAMVDSLEFVPASRGRESPAGTRSR